MRKLLLVLLSGASVMSFAKSLDMSTLSCGSTKLTSATTLADVQKDCMIKKQAKSKGMYKVEFTNTATNKTVSCYFAKNDPAATLNSCKD